MNYVLTGPWADPELATRLTGASGRRDGGALGVDLSPEAAAALRFHADVHGARVEIGPDSAWIAPGLTDLAGCDLTATLSPRWAAIWREAAAEILDCRGRQTPGEVRARLVMIWCRAESHLRARAAPRRARGGFTQANLRVRSVTTPYARFFLLRDYVYDHDLFGGGTSGPLDRAAMVMADAVTVLPWDPMRDRVLLIEQVRASPIARDDPCPWMLEPVAGRIDPTDTPEDAAHREAMEEARLGLSALHKVGEYYPSTGAFSEYLYSFIGIADLPDTAAQLGGLATEGEDIRGHVMARAEMMALIADGQAPVGPLLLSAFWLEAHAERLRRSA